MGGRGSSSGVSDKGKPYGSEYTTVMKPHTHHGYFHNENDSKKGAANLTVKERKMVDRINNLWYNRK
jgi:hypothetical protein